MIRLHEVFLSLAAAAFVAALVLSGRTGSDDRGWDPAESQAGLLHCRDAASAQSSFSSVGPTLKRWKRSASAPQVRVATFEPGLVRGVTVSLTNPQIANSTGTTQGPAGPDIAIGVCSIKPLNQQLGCSTDAYSYGSGDFCSVDTNNNSGTTYSCSTTAGSAYCSTNVGNGAGPKLCSVSGTGTSTNACSAGARVGDNCSTQANSGNSGSNSYYCCAGLQGGTDTKNDCSTNYLSGSSNPLAAKCSATAGTIPGGSTQRNFCSVDNSGASGSENSCSTAASGDPLIATNCSTYGADGANTTTDTCSVSAAAIHAVCTTISGTPSGDSGKCSVMGGGGAGGANNCSVVASGGVTPPGSNNQCGTP